MTPVTMPYLPSLRPIRVAWSAATLVVLLVAQTPVAQNRTQATLLQDGIVLMESRGDARGAVVLFEQVSRGPDRSLAARGLLHLGMARERLGRAQARSAYERVLREYIDQSDVVAEARRRLRALGNLSAVTPPRTVAARRLWGADFTPTAPAHRGSAQVLGVTQRGEVALRHVTTLDTRVLLPAEDGRSPLDAAFSPDGTQLATLAYRAPPRGPGFEFVLTSASGERPRIVYAARAPLTLFGGWFPGGRDVLLYVTWPGGASELLRVASSDGSARRLATLPAGSPYKVSVSPDGTTAACDLPVRGAPSERDIVLIDLASGAATPLAHPAIDAFPVWTPDGRLLFASDRSGTFSLWMVDVVRGRVEGEPQLVRRDIGSLMPPAGVSSDGALLYRVTEGLVDVHVASLDAMGDGYAPGRRPGRRVQGVNLSPDWSPDGRRVVFTSRLGALAPDVGAPVLTIVDVETGEDRVIDVALGNLFMPRWSPDGRTIAVHGMREGLGGAHLIDVASGEVLAGPIGAQVPVEWLPGSDALLVVRDRTLVWQSIAGGDVRVVYTSPEGTWLGTPVVSPDGLRAAVGEFHRTAGHAARVVMVPLEGESPREIFSAKARDTLSLAGWSPDGTVIYMLWWTPTSPNSPRTLWRLPASGGAPVSTGISQPTIRDVRVSRDGRRMAYTTGWPTHASWILEHFLPTRRPSTRP